MKRLLAKSLVWWPGMDMEIESMVKCCHDCQQSQPAPPAAPLPPWQWPTWSWSRLHVDFAGPLEGKMFLIVIDAHLKWLKVFPMMSATSFTTIEHLRKLFAQFGIPETIVTDNGTQFTAAEFKQFCTRNGIHTSHFSGPLPSILKWISRTGCENLQARIPQTYYWENLR